MSISDRCTKRVEEVSSTYAWIGIPENRSRADGKIYRNTVEAIKIGRGIL